MSPASIVESARTLPMLGDRRHRGDARRAIVEAETQRKDRGSGGAEEEADLALDDSMLVEHVQRPEPSNAGHRCDVDRSRRLFTLQKHAVIVECWGLKGAKDARLDLRQVASLAEQLVRKAVADAGQQIDPRAARLVAERAGTDIATLRGDMERLLLFAAGKPKIELKDVQEVVTAETSQDDWAVTNAIERGNAPEALRQLALSLDSGGVPYMILGQLGYFVRTGLVRSAPRRVPAAVEALFRTDIDLKSSGGDPRVLLERLVIELCRR